MQSRAWLLCSRVKLHSARTGAAHQGLQHVLQEAAPEQGDAPKEGRRRLEDEPLLAARIVVEECLNCLLDLDDIDRMWVNSAAPRNDKAELQRRRSDLLEVRCVHPMAHAPGRHLPAAP